MTVVLSPSHAPTYTPAVFDHLESLRRSFEAQRDIALLRIEQCNAEGDSDGVKIAQIDSNLALRSLLVVRDQIFAAQREMMNGSAGGYTGKAVLA